MLGADSLWDLCLRLFGYSLWFNLLLHSLQLLHGSVLQTVNDASLWQLDSVYFRSGLLLFGFEPERTIQFHILRAQHDDRSLPVTRFPLHRSHNVFHFYCREITLTPNRTQNSAPALARGSPCKSQTGWLIDAGMPSVLVFYCGACSRAQLLLAT